MRISRFAEFRPPRPARDMAFGRRVLRCAVMRPAHRAPRGFSLLAGVLIAAFLAQSFLASAIKSPVFDETGDIAAGLSYVQSGEVRANLQHPPLLKEMAGAALWLAVVRLPATPQARQMLADGGGERTVGSQLIAANGPDRTMFWARLPFLLLAAALGLLLYLWGRQLLGDMAALAALFLYTLDPAILGHGYLATMDVGLAAFTVLFLFALWHYLERPDTIGIPLAENVRRIRLAGKSAAPKKTQAIAHQRGTDAFVCQPGDLSVSFTAPDARGSDPSHDREGVVKRSTSRLICCGLTMGLMLCTKFSAVFLLPVAAVLILAAVTRTPRTDGSKAPGSYGALALAFVIMGAIATLVIQAVYLSPGGLALYSTGFERVNADHNPDYLVFLGAQSEHHFASYFAAAYLLKEPLAAILLSGAGLFALRGKASSRRVKLFLLLPPAVVFAAHTVFADNLGMRYIIPVLPFAYLVGGAGAAALGLWMLAANVGIYPDHLSYFNEAACLTKNPAAIGLDGGTRLH